MTIFYRRLRATWMLHTTEEVRFAIPLLGFVIGSLLLMVLILLEGMR